MQPIDYVVPMVFTDDEQWRDECSRSLNRPKETLEDTPRWRSWGTEELLIRGILINMPWIRRIHIILSGESQVRPWMKDISPKVNIVFHKDFIPEQYLPCFVSRTIEMFLDNIQGLAERFIYGNDDMYPVGAMRPEDFFVGNKPCQHHDEVYYEDATYVNDIFKRSCFNELNMIASDFGKKFTTTYLLGGHSLSPILRKTCKAVWKTHEKDILENISVVRTDHSMNHYIYPFYQHLSGKYVDHVPRSKYVSMWEGMKDILAAIADRNLQVVCVNDDEVANTVWQTCAMKVRNALEQRLTIEQEENEGRGTEAESTE